MRGRKPKPTARHIAEGDPSKFGVHKLDAKLEAEPKATRGLPPCPNHLKGITRKAWRFWAEELEGMSLDCRPDAMMLEACCVFYQTHVEMYELIEQQGSWSLGGSAIPRPANSRWSMSALIQAW